jgi:hypothetical protein
LIFFGFPRISWFSRIFLHPHQFSIFSWIFMNFLIFYFLDHG